MNAVDFPTLRLTAWRRFSLPWTGPLGARNCAREGFLVRWSSCTNTLWRHVWTEASPLPGWSRESTEDTAAWLFSNTRKDALEAVQVPVLPAALAWSHSVARSHFRGAWSVEGKPVSLAALLRGGAQGWQEQAEAAWQAGARTFKLKISPAEVRAAGDFLRWVDKNVEGGAEPVVIRLDANRRFTYEEAMAAFPHLHHARVEFWEEPLSCPQLWPRLLRECPIPLALDETLREIAPAELSRFAGVVALVIKPTLMGDGGGIEEWVREGAAWGLKVVVSAAYESGVGMADLIRLAASLSNGVAAGVAAGLDTYSSLQDDVLRERWDFSRYYVGDASTLPLSGPPDWKPSTHPIWRESWEDVRCT